MKIYHLLEGGGGLGTFSLSCLLSFSEHPRWGKVQLTEALTWPFGLTWDCKFHLSMSCHILFIYKGISFLFHLFSFAIISSEFQILPSCHHCSFLHSSAAFLIPQLRVCFLAFSEPGHSFRNHPPALTHL